MILLIGSAALAWLSAGRQPLFSAVLIGVTIAALCVGARLAVRGYTLTETEIHVKRLGRTTRLALRALTAVDGKADAMDGSVCLLANPGLFSVTGYFWNRRLKFYRAYVTDPSRAVILRFTNRVLVITPHDPQHFIMRARTLMKTAE
jgi:hypothetical protein